MEKLIGYICDYKKDIFYLSALLFIFILLSLFTGPVFGNIYVDCAREAYVPELILKGKVIYKDFFALFLPLSYWFNAFLYLIFGKAFKVLYFYSYFNAWIILCGIYLICRIFLKEYLSAVTTLAFMCLYILGNPFSVLTYIFPYAFAMVYAVTCFTYSVLLFLYYMKTDNKKLLYSSFLLLGFVYANKPEFLLCFIPMFAVMFFKHEKFKHYVFTALFMLIPSLACIAVLFLQGFNFNDLISYFTFSAEFFNSSEEKHFLLNMLVNSFKDTRKFFSDIVYFFTLFFVSVAYVSLYFKNKYYKIFALILIPAYFMLMLYLININLVKGYTVNWFGWYYPVLIFIIISKIGKIETLNDKMLMFLAVTGVLSSSRLLFLPIWKLSYAIYYIFPILAFWLWFITSRKNTLNVKIISVVLIILSVTYVPPYKYLADILEVLEFKSSKGNIIDLYYESKSFSYLVDLINKTSNKTDTVLVLPEGTLLNHVTGRPTKPKLYQLTPNHITALGEDNIVNELKQNPPEFIVFTDVIEFEYGEGRICETFAYKICGYVNENYEKIAEFDVALKVYKLNK